MAKAEFHDSKPKRNNKSSGPFREKSKHLSNIPKSKESDEKLKLGMFTAKESG